MNKLFSKIAGLSIGLAMAIGVGVAVASNRNVTFVSATVGSDVTIGNGTYTSAYETGFENCTASTTYNSTKTYTSSEADGAAWSVYYGTVSTSSKLTGTKSMHMRWYSSAKTNYPHAETTSPIANVKAFKFNYAVGNKNVDFKVQYGTNGSSWTDIETVNTTGTDTTEYNHEFTSAISTFYFRVLVCDGTAPSSGNYTFRIDDIVFGSPKAVACTVTLNKNGGSGGTDSVSATKGSAMPTLVSAPTRTGYTFAGYYDDASAGTQYYTANRASARNWDKDGTTATLYAHWTANQYNINYYDQGGSDFSGEHESGYPTKHTYGTETILKGATKGGYNFDGWFTTSECTGSAVTSLGATSYTDAISLYAKWTATGNIYSITTTVTNGTYSGDTTITDNGGVASVTIAPTGDYKLPASVSVSGADHTYNASTGDISLSNATGNVTISAAMVALTEYSITVNKTNASYTGDTTIKESRTASLTFEPDSGYGQPASVTVTGATYTWTRGTGVLSLSNPTGNVSVTYVASENELTSITLGTQKTAYILGEDFSMPVVTAHYSVAADKVVTGSATESGYDQYSIGNQSITISYTEGGITQTSSYSVTVSAKEIETTTTWTRVTSAATLKAGGTFILGYEATANSGEIIPMANTGSATTSTAGFMYSGSTASSGGTGTINMSTLGNNGSDFEIAVGASSAVNDAIYLKVGDNYIGNQDTKNNCKLFTEQSATTSFGVSVGSNDVLTLTIAANSSYTTLQYNSGSPRFAVYGGTQKNLVAYQKVTESSGSASLIRIVCDPSIDAETGYKGGAKFVGDPVYTSDFVVKKQLDTGNALTAITDFTINGGTEVELTSTSNNIVVSYTEGGITKNTTVVVEATQRAAELESVELVEKGTIKKSGYIDYPSATWNLDNIYVHYYWSDEEFDTEVTLASLVATHDATLSPAKPIVGETSFSVSYEYLEVQVTNNTITLTEAVKADYVTSISWTGTSASQFKAYSGGQLTAQQVAAWTVVPTFAGAGEQSALSFGDYVLKVGTKTISSLPYTWTSEDDGQELSITYGKDADGNDFVKKNATAVGNICATINAIDYEETISGDQSIVLDVTDASAYSKTGTSGTGSETEVTLNGFTIWSDKGYASDGESMRVYSGAEFKISSDYTIKSVSFTFTGGKTGLTGGAGLSTNEYSETASAQARVVTITIEYTGSVTTTVHYANDMDHFEAQKTVVAFAKFMNTTMNGENVCSGTFANLKSAWGTVRDKYDELFGESTTLDAIELAWAKNMLKYANAAWGSDAENACVEKAMKTYEICIAKHGVDPFMFESDGTTPLRSISSTPSINMLISKNSSAVITIIVISAISLAAIGGYFLFRKKKED